MKQPIRKIATAQLIPHTNSHNVQITVRVERLNTQVSFEYQLIGDLQAVFIPTIHEKPARQDQLWENTCWEAFLTWEGTSSYWELNLSPTLDWNLFYFDHYRSERIWEKRIPAIDATILQLEPGRFTEKAVLDLAPLLSEQLENTDKTLLLGISAILKGKDHSISHWALVHTGVRPDFHARDSFIWQI